MLALERRLSCSLFRRLPRGYDLTDDGHDLLTKAATIESQIHPLINPAFAQGTLLIKISAGVWISHLLCEAASELIGSDKVRLRFVAADELTDIGRREALIGIRNHRPSEIGLAGRRITRIRFAVYARHESVVTWARVIGNTPSARWVKDATRNAKVIEVTSPRNALDLVLAGTARAVLPTFIGGQIDALKPISPMIDELEHDQWLVTHQDDRFLPEVRRVIDRIYAILKANTA